MLRRLLALLSLACACALAQAAPAAHIADAVPQARLAGAGTFTWFTMKIYSAELWVGPQGYQAQAPFALDLRYARKLDGAKIADASAEQMAKIGAGSAAQRQAWLARMKAIFPDVNEGSRITGVHMPGEGARFYLDGKALGTVADPAFARAFFGIWLDPATTAPALRTALLANAAPP
ncbi:MAG: chalcone isomerase family protein [Pseudomonadota bacterium]